VKTLICCVLISFLIQGCGGNGGSVTNSGENHQYIPLCGNLQDGGFSNAILLSPGEQINRLEANTRIRIWHTANSDKFACTVQGKAIIIGG